MRRRMTAFLCILVILVSSIFPYLNGLTVYGAEKEYTEYEWIDEAEAPSVYAAQDEEAVIADATDQLTSLTEEEITEEAPEVGETIRSESVEISLDSETTVALEGKLPVGGIAQVAEKISDVENEVSTYDINVQDDNGDDWEPEEQIKVTIENEEYAKLHAQGYNITIQHIHGEKIEYIDATIDGSTITFYTESFSDFTVIWENLIDLWEQAIGFANRVTTTILSEADVTISLSGRMPRTATVEASEEDVQIDGMSTVYAFDISLMNQGSEIQPQNGAIAVEIQGEEIRSAIEAGKELAVFHIADDGTKTPVEDFSVDGDKVRFEAESFSVYVVTGHTIEKTIEASDGNTYKITVEYDDDAGIPGGAELEVSEIADEDYADYLTAAVKTLGVDIHRISYSKLFDIAIVKDGVEYQPNEAVNVKVELLDAERIANVQVVHFENKRTAAKLDASTNGATVTFATTGFSVFSFLDFSLLNRVVNTVLGEQSGTLYENDDIILSGSMPAMGIVEAERLDVSVNDQETLVAYDINIYANPIMRALGINWQPGAGAIQVTVKSDALNTESVDVYHLEDISSEPELVAEDLAVENNSVTFDAASFSVYALTPATYHRTYRFFTYDENMQYVEYMLYTDQGTTTYTQIIKNGETLIVPQLPAIPGSSTSTFAGWYAGTGDVSNAPIDPESITLESTEFDFENIPPITENGEEVHLFAKFADYSYVVFHDQYNGSTSSFPIAMTRRAEMSDGHAEVQISDVSVAYDDSAEENTETEMAFYGWSYTKITTAGSGTDDNGNAISRIDTDRITIPNEYTDPVTGATDLYPIFMPIHWLSFYSGSAGSGATYIPSKYYYLDEGPSSLSVPVRSGYTFKGWYTGSVDDSDHVTYGTQITDAEGALIEGVNDTAYGARVENGKLLLAEDVQLFAKWEEALVNYSIVIWRQKATDAANLADVDKSYDYAESYVLTATTGTTVSVANNYKNFAGSGDYVGFNYGRCDNSKTAEGDGSTVLNVYYDRNVHTLKFQQSANSSTPIKTITELYGHNIADYFPIEAGGTVYTAERWQPQTNNLGWTEVMTTLWTMPDGNVTFIRNNSNTNYPTKTMYYYVEALPGETGSRNYNGKSFVQYNEVRARYNGVTSEDFIDIIGFEHYGWTDANGNSNPYSNTFYIYSTTQNQAIYFYYTRNERTISFLDSGTGQNVYVDGSQIADISIKYDEAISNYVPDTPTPKQLVTVDGVPTVQDRPGYTFTGWFVDEACRTRVFFDENDPTYQEYLAQGRNCVLYDKMPNNNLRVYAGWETEWYLIKIDPNGGSGLDSDQHGSTWYWEPYNGDPIEEYTWVTRHYVESRDGTYYYVKHDRDYYGYTDEWNSNESNERSVYYSTNPGEATSLTTYKYAENAYRYAGWYEVLYDTDGNEIGEQLYSFGDPVTHNTTLRLHWKKIGTYYVSYDAGAGTIDSGDSNETLFFELDGDDYADNAEVVVSRTARAPAGYNFVGWKIRGDTSETIYYPGQTFVFEAKNAVTVNGRETIFLDAVYNRVSTAKIIYDANGGTITEQNLDYGSPTDSSAPTPTMSCDTSEGTATISNLINNSEVRLSDGSGFFMENATLIGWSTKPNFNPDTDTLFELNHNYYVDSEEPVTLYAVWAVKVYFIKNNGNANWGVEDGTYWDSDVYTYDSANDRYYTTVYINNTVDQPSYVPVSSDTTEMFYYWGTQRYAGTIEPYDFATPVTEELYLYGFWDKTKTIPIHAVDSSTETLVNKDADWLTEGIGTEVQVNSGTPVSFATAADAAAYADKVPDGYEFAFACVSNAIENCSEEKAIDSVWYNTGEASIYVTYKNGSQGALTDTDEIYLVYYQNKTLPIGYKLMDTDGTLSDVVRYNNPPQVTGTLGTYSVNGTLTTPINYGRPSSSTYYPFYSYAIGNVDAGTEADLHYITSPASDNNNRPELQIRNTWRGFEYSTDGNTWINAGYEPEIYVIYFDYKPIVITLNEITKGLSADMSKEFEYEVVVETVKEETEYSQTGRSTKSGYGWWAQWSDYTYTNNSEYPKYNSGATEKTTTYYLSSGDSETIALFCVDNEGDWQYGPVIESGNGNTRTQTRTRHSLKITTTVTITQKNYTSDGFTTTNDGTGGDRVYVYTYTTDSSSRDETVTYTNTRTPLTVEAHLGIVGANGTIALSDSNRLEGASPYTISLDLGGDEKTFLTEIPASSLYEAEGYGFAGVYYGTDDGTTVTLTGEASTITYGQITAPNIYEPYLNGDSSTLLGNNKIYYLYYPLPKLVYVKETSGGTLSRIQGSTDESSVTDTITYNGEVLTLNGTTVAQEQLLPVNTDTFTISQAVGSGNFNMPPRLDDGTEKLFLLYTKLGAAGTENAANTSDLQTVTENKVLYLKVDGNQVKWSLDASTWNSFTDTAPTVYAIYKETGYDLQITKTVTGEGADITKNFTLTISSLAITESSYSVSGTGYSTVSATPASGSTPGTITLTIKHGSDITISGLGRGDYTLTETSDATMSAKIGDDDQPVTNNSVTIYNMHANTRVDITNEMNVTTPAPTDYHTNRSPFAIMFLVGLLLILAAGAYIFTTKKRKEDDVI